ncbi:unnamed protein product [Cyclocybe aegerita]|uniref:Uncharacterized protein n=1 Tax=Cyclocybe aegerita TaxID=1973307 RepID=A0A8S0VZ29_CYCAE|nr:unnamed protein product [Cyclocybe aegerita]
MPPATRPPYKGTRRKLVLAFDVGTTYSGISYSILDPGRVPEVKGVTRFPAHEQTNGSSKIPTLIYYNEDEEACAVGVRYTHANGTRLWSSVEDSIDFVLSHPNGWEGAEQNQIRKAAVLAGLIPDNPSGHARITFVTEGEASLHFAIQQGVLVEAMEEGNAVVVVDAGGGTIDVSSYTRRQSTGAFEEVAPTRGSFKISSNDDFSAKETLRLFSRISVCLHPCSGILAILLGRVPYLDDIEHIVECFDDTTKIRFKSDTKPQYIKFGSTRDNDATYNIRFGQLKLDGADVAGFFRPSVQCIVNAVLEQRRLSRPIVQSVLMVGGFASNDWLLENVQIELGKYGLNVFRSEEHINKAVSDGAVSFYLDNVVRVRVSKATLGTLSSVEYNRKDPDHISRAKSIFLDHSGDKRLPDRFNIILRKNTQVSEATEFRQRFGRVYSNRSDLRTVSTVIWCYRGTTSNPVWKSDDPGHYSEFCTVTTDLSHIQIKPKKNDKGDLYYRLEYDLVLLFGFTEIQAQIAWKENV